MKMRSFVVLGATVLALATTACGKQGAPGSSRAAFCDKPTKLAVAHEVNIPDSPTFAAMKSRGHVVVGVKVDQPYLGYKDATGRRCGFDIEIARLMSARLGFAPNTIQYKEIPTANRETAIQSHEIDYYVGSYTILEKRRRQVSFAGPYLIAGQSVLVRKDETGVTSKDSLRGKRVCGATGTTSIQRVADLGLTQRTNIVEFKTGSECLSQLLDKKVDALSTDDAILKGYAAADPGELKLVGTPFSTEKYGIGLPKADRQLRDAMNDALAAAVTDGTWKKLYDATLGKSGVPASPPAVERN
ncbi:MULTISPECIES: glutamate ABC transporter substrate-binding protein [unclassified Streptomyces]|uniref:glutamate ABC transporter substrate-binding protein n=1 Tax=unclassified Streptomyces TaxID=2593676 RepID=UPI002E325758|nr:glutamate ABC transporter substrate-binding protein [Streptomyces sp. NBC_01361]